MRYLKLVPLLFFALSTANVAAQKDNAKKIVGCWILKKIELIKKDNYSNELIKNTQNAVVCFSPDGKFTSNTPQTGTEPITGSYKVSDDGKTMSQKSDVAEDEDFVAVEEDLEIELVDDKHLVFKFAAAIVYFDRK